MGLGIAAPASGRGSANAVALFSWIFGCMPLISPRSPDELAEWIITKNLDPNAVRSPRRYGRHRPTRMTMATKAKPPAWTGRNFLAGSRVRIELVFATILGRNLQSDQSEQHLARPVNESSNGTWPLQALNFFMADFQAGIGPFLGVFLLAHGWKSGMIGTVMTIGGVAGMLMTTPAGAMIDATTHKRAYVIIPGICTIAASALILLSQSFWVVAASQVATAIAGAAIVPAVIGMTLGIVHQAGFNRQNGRNQAFNHAGNMVGAALSGYLGWKFGFAAVFVLAAVFGVLSIFSVLAIPRDAIDDHVARGANADSSKQPASAWQVLFECKPLLVLAAALALFHLGNAAMLPLYGLAVVSGQQGNGAGFVAMTIVVAQGVMIVASIAAMRMAEKEGYWLVLLFSFIALPVRGLIAASVIKYGGFSGAGARRHWCWLAECSRPGSGRPHSQWHRAGQCRARRGHDGAGNRCCPQSGHWRLAGAGIDVSQCVRDPGMLCDRLDRDLAFMCRSAQAGLRRQAGRRRCRRVNSRVLASEHHHPDPGCRRPIDIRSDRTSVAPARICVGGDRCGHPGRIRSAVVARCCSRGGQGYRCLFLSDRHDTAFGSGAPGGLVRLARGICRASRERFGQAAVSDCLRRRDIGDGTYVQRRYGRCADACRLCRPRPLLGVEPLPYLLICAFIANAASFVLPISNPANLIIFGAHMPPLSHWLYQFLLPSIASILVTYAALRFTQRLALNQKLAEDLAAKPLSAGGKCVAIGIGLTAVALLAASALDWQLGLPTFIAGTTVTVVVLLIARQSPWPVLRDVSWGVLPLVAGLFILVESVEQTGILYGITRMLHERATAWPHETAVGVGAIVALASIFLNNLPTELVAATVGQNADVPLQVSSGLVIGVDLGPNLSVTGSLATILWLVALRREGEMVTAWHVSETRDHHYAAGVAGRPGVNGGDPIGAISGFGTNAKCGAVRPLGYWI